MTEQLRLGGLESVETACGMRAWGPGSAVQDTFLQWDASLGSAGSMLPLATHTTSDHSYSSSVSMGPQRPIFASYPPETRECEAKYMTARAHEPER